MWLGHARTTIELKRCNTKQTAFPLYLATYNYCWNFKYLFEASAIFTESWSPCNVFPSVFFLIWRIILLNNSTYPALSNIHLEKLRWFDDFAVFLFHHSCPFWMVWRVFGRYLFGWMNDGLCMKIDTFAHLKQISLMRYGFLSSSIIISMSESPTHFTQWK